MKRAISIKSVQILFCLLAFLPASYAQKIDSMINVYGESYPQEKVHVHFDKSVYNPGETIWFKAYLFSGFMPSAISKNFYAELIDPATGKMLQRKTLPIFESSSASNFDLPLTLNLPEVVFRAYTTWMMNFDTTFLYTKTIRIITKSPAASSVTDNKPVINFFPEGGDLVGGLSTTVAFKAVDGYGYPIKVKGTVKDTKGASVASFSSVHDGMGRFDMEPASGNTYTAEWQDSTGTTYKTELPGVKNQGAILQISGAPGRKTFIVKRAIEGGAELKKLYIVGHMYQQVVYKATVDLNTNFMTSGVIPVANLPSGILQVTLFNSNWQPLAERITFINNNDFTFTPNVITLGKNLEKRGRNIITVDVPDTLKTNLSIAITDAGVGDDGQDNIISRILLTGDLKGYVFNPAYYLSSDADSVQQHLDLVMMTNGWRRFKWEDLAAGKLPVIKFPRENYLSLKGELLGLQPSQIPPNTSLNVFLEAKDSSRQIFSLPVDSRGKFGEDGLIFFDTVKVYYQFNQNKQLAGRAVVNFDNGSFKVPSLIRSSPAWRVINPADSFAIKRSRFVAEEADRIRPELARKVKTLEAVTVTARQRSRSQLLDQRYTSGLFSGGDAYSFDMSEDPFANSARDIFQFLQGRVAGLMISPGGVDGPTLTWRQGTPTLYLDEMRVDAGMLQGVSVSDVAYVKVFRPPFFGAPGGGSGGAIAVYTKKGGDASSSKAALPGGLEKNRLVGYSPPKEFYSPDYSKDSPLYDVPDVRTTLYWAPYILTDKANHKASFTFYNNDISKKYKIVLEGFNEEGRMTRVEKIVQ